ncbi:MAG TPA: hypothetical protein VFX85_13430 [Solirubrobacterales bacterium]|nr:hypothetical protein [Solirubrobacterales bacterium]
MHESSTNQLAHCAAASVFGVASVRVGVQDKDQLIHRQSGRVFG